MYVYKQVQRYIWIQFITSAPPHQSIVTASIPISLNKTTKQIILAHSIPTSLLPAFLLSHIKLLGG